MERRVRIGLIKGGVAALAFSALVVCSNPIDIVGSVKTDVMLANNKFLIIKSGAPAKNALNVNPSDPVWVELDRDLDTSTVTPQAVTFSPAATWSFTYNDATRTLFIQPDALGGNTTYTVTFTSALKGMDGNCLQDPYVVSFKTADLPSGSLKINNGASSTTSNTVTLNFTYNAKVTGLRYSMNKSDITNDGTGALWIAMTPSVSFNLSGQMGTNTVYVQFRDALDNRTSSTNPLNDSIIYGAPTVTSATLNTAALGSVTVSWQTLPRQDSGTNYYYLYRWNAPDWSSGTYLGNTTGGSMTVSVPQGQAYFFQVLMYNPAAGSVWSTNYQVGYTSNIVIVYNSSDSTDTNTASALKNVLTTNIPKVYAGTITGTMPTWSVTLVPQSLVPTTAASGSVFYGYPVIVTPGTTIYASAGQTWNVTAHGHGVVAMGTAGANLLNTVNANFITWGFSGTAPADIAIGQTMGIGSGYYANVWNTGNSTWSYPLTCASIPTVNGSSVQLFYNPQARRGVYRAAQDNPTAGWLYAQDSATYPYHFPVVRQDRFLLYGFEGLADRPYTGWVFTTNLIYRMSSVYF